MKKHEKFSNLLSDSQVDINSLDHICNKIVESCTKEAIAVIELTLNRFDIYFVYTFFKTFLIRMAAILYLTKI